ncbi:MAG: tRNA (adenosine(37)-N6)-threonylcarbamoyltransferase complex transferase subunit TsaD [Terriglobia bacterium]
MARGDPRASARILAIESSCDETAAAIVADGERILANVVSSQVDLHGKYGGVVPELASRAHLENIVPVVREAFAQAGLAYAEVDAIAVTQGPGLIGSLLVGVTFAKTMAWSLAKPLIAVNHLEGHIHAVLLEQRQSNGQVPIEFPAVTLVVSGGHTVLYRVEQESIVAHPGKFILRYRRVGETVDDAAGEAFDKVAKHLGLGYPGGPVVDRLAPAGNADAVIFTKPRIKHGTPYDFSFSGIKTAVVRYVERHALAPEIATRKTKLRENPKANLKDLCSQQTLDLIASFQKTVVEDLTERTLAAADDFAARAVFVSGGVAANSLLRKIFREESAGRGLPVFFPSVALSTDNAAMIAAAAYPKFLAGEFVGLELNADPSLPLGR